MSIAQERQKTWEEEKEEMKKVIDTQAELLQRFKKEKMHMLRLIEQQKQHIENYTKSVQNLENEFSVCSEDICFSDVGGLEPVLDKIKYFEYGLLYPRMYEVYAIRPPRGLLLHGPPGCGKTMIAKAISNELDCFFLEIPVTRIISKWVGEAEKTLEAILKKCNEVYSKEKKKVLIYVDEAEQMFRSRGAQRDGVIDRCVTVWLRYMDGLEPSEGMIYVASTNRVGLIDEAIKRAGRFDHIIEVPAPDRVGVEDILRKQIAYKERITKREIYRLDDINRLADSMYVRGVTGADIAEILRLTSEKQIREFIEMEQEQLIMPEEVYIYQKQLELAVEEYSVRKQGKVARAIGFER